MHYIKVFPKKISKIKQIAFSSCKILEYNISLWVLQQVSFLMLSWSCTQISGSQIKVDNNKEQLTRSNYQ